MQYHWKLLKPLYKYTKTFILLTAHKKTAIAMATNMKKKNIFCSTVGGWYKELKVKELCVFDFIELLFVNGVFQNNYFKTYFAENKVKVHMFEVPHCGLLDWAFVVLCVWLL